MGAVGLFGGSFNPIHNGHINLALSVKEKLSLDRVILIPSGEAPHKSSAEYAGSADRLEMCRLAAEGHDGLEVSDWEITRPGKSYSVYTTEYFRELYPHDRIYLLVGSDMLLSFDKWYRYKDILKNADLAAVSRSGDDYAALDKMAKKLSEWGEAFVVKSDTITISSSEIRQKIKNNEDLYCYLDKKVVKYIVQKNLYRD
ncbi:MAG: nicotinate (nicotinamide) nucleotide adenylyltransferase [Porcipelethomonas sp.]